MSKPHQYNHSVVAEVAARLTTLQSETERVQRTPAPFTTGYTLGLVNDFDALLDLVGRVRIRMVRIHHDNVVNEQEKKP